MSRAEDAQHQETAGGQDPHQLAERAMLFAAGKMRNHIQTHHHVEPAAGKRQRRDVGLGHAPDG